jgi:predicted kinase
MKSLQLTKPHLLVVVGLPGSGKTFFAVPFSDTFNAPFLDYKHYEYIAKDAAIGTKLASHMLSQLLRTKQTIIIEGRGSSRAQRQELIKLAHKNGYQPLFVWVQTEPVSAEQRSVHSKTATLTKDEFDRQVKQFEHPVRSEPYLVISGKHTHPSQAKTVLKRLVGDRPAAVPVAIRQMPRRGSISG